MKWARVRDKSQQSNPKNKDAEQERKNDEACYDDYPDQKTMEKEIIQPKNLWADYDLRLNFPKPEIDYPKFQKHYEVFCGGYLLFYDMVVRNKSVDHTILFKWSPEKNNKKYTVKIYMSPAPLKPIDNYTKTCGQQSDDYYNKQKKNKQSLQKMSPEDGDLNDGFSVDPPPPPPPPPPPMH